MAIKISGTTVIDDSCNVTNANEFCATTLVGDGSSLTGLALLDRILKPGNQSPAANATIATTTPTLCGTIFVSSEGKSHCCTCFQVSECSDFSANNVFTCEIAGGCTSIIVPDSCLAAENEYFFRLRYEDEDTCCSNFSDTTSFCIPNLFDVLGESIGGGFYMGTICAAGTCYYLVMAPNATGCAACQWKTETGSSGTGACGTCNGYAITYDIMTNAEHPAGNWTATRTINGFSDWYLPARCELTQLYCNCACAPAGEGFAAGTNEFYWSANEDGAYSACRKSFCNGSDYSGGTRTETRRVRAIRRVAFS